MIRHGIPDPFGSECEALKVLETGKVFSLVLGDIVLEGVKLSRPND